MLLTLVAAVGAVYLIAPRRRHPVPSRVRPGDHVVTDEGLEGWVEQVDGPAARIRIDAGPSIWARAGDLMTAPSARTRPAAGHGSPTPDADTGDTGGFASPAPQLQHLADSGGALARLAARVYDHRKRTIVVWALVLVAALPLAGTAAKAFTPGGFLPSDSETGRVQESMGPRFGLPQTTLHVIVDEPVATAGPKLADLRAHPGALEHLTFTGQPTASTDGRSTAIEYGFSVSDEQVQLQIAPLEAALAKRGFDAAHIRVAGVAAMFHDIETQTNEDLAKAESIGMPVAMVVLILVFGTLVAAFVPMLVGVMSVLVTLAVLHLISTQYGLSIYVMNIASMLGLGLGIDYSLLSVSRFRLELARDGDVRRATITTVTSAGRAAMVSGVAVLVGIAALGLFPLGMLRSVAIAGVVVVAVTVVASLTLLPAVLACLGPRVERLRVRRARPPAPADDVTAASSVDRAGTA